MSPSDMQTILNQIPTDEDMQAQFFTVLRGLATENEAFKRQLLAALKDNADFEPERKRRWMAVNLKPEFILQIVLTGVLVAVFGVYVFLTFKMITVKPEGIPMGNGQVEMFDPFGRARDLLTLIIPVFATVVSFWLGFAIQGSKVNQAEQVADEQRQMRENADKIMAKVEGMAMMMPEGEVRQQLHQLMQDK